MFSVYLLMKVSNMYILEIEITDNTIEISQPGGEKVESYDACKEIRGKINVI